MKHNDTIGTLGSLALLVACIVGLMACPLHAQGIDKWSVRIYNVGAVAPLFGPLDLLAANVQCNQVAPANTTTVNPNKIIFNDDANVGKVCIWTDPGTGVLTAVPFGAAAYEGTVTATNAAGTSAESSRASFTHPGVLPGVPSGLRFGR